MRLQDKVAIVTGGGSGIGTAYTRRFLAEGAKVMIADIGEEQGRKAAAELAQDGDVEFVRTDIADPASAQAAVDATVERFGRVDILMNNAAIYGDYNGGDTSLDKLRPAMLALKYDGLFGPTLISPNGYAITSRVIIKAEQKDGLFVWTPVKTYTDVVDPNDK